MYIYERTTFSILLGPHQHTHTHKTSTIVRRLLISLHPNSLTMIWKKTNVLSSITKPSSRHKLGTKPRSSNPYSGRGLERWALVCAELEALRREKSLGYQYMNNTLSTALLYDQFIEKTINPNPNSNLNPNPNPNPDHNPNPKLQPNLNPNPYPKANANPKKNVMNHKAPVSRSTVMAKLLRALTIRRHVLNLPSSDNNSHDQGFDSPTTSANPVILSSRSADAANIQSLPKVETQNQTKYKSIETEEEEAATATTPKNDNNSKTKTRGCKIKCSAPSKDSRNSKSAYIPSSSSSSSSKKDYNMIMSSKSLPFQDVNKDNKSSSSLNLQSPNATIASDENEKWKEKVGKTLEVIGIVLGLSGLVTGYIIAILGVVCWWYVLPTLRNAIGYKPIVVNRGYKAYYTRHGQTHS